jgi:hypothetical protein
LAVGFHELVILKMTGKDVKGINEKGDILT